MVVCYMAVIPMFIGYLTFGFGLRYVHASKATLLTLFEPVVAALLAVLIVGESISLVGWFGIVLVITCLFLQSQNKTKMIKINRS
ncbi:EamA family transporter [uncultured Psychromonas sp.]|uniref:EamA family transporter n=1 Tax=uncultured Psychromonas sp. TaxID=173974 RepID=UPI003459875C